jgi:hypothetical protein
VKANDFPGPADVVYRATAASGRLVEVRFVTLQAAAATVADAWARLSAVGTDIDPMSIEIEVWPWSKRIARASTRARPVSA